MVKPDWVLRYLPTRRPDPWQSIGIGIGTVALATVIRWALGPWLGYHGSFISYFPALLVLSVWCGFRVAALAMLAEAGLAVLLFFAPRPIESGGVWGLVAFVSSSFLMIAIGSSLSQALRLQAESEERLRASEHSLQTLVSELGHRAKNGHMVVAAIVAQSARGAQTVAECESLITSRLGSMAKAQDLVLDAGGGVVELQHLLETVLAPYDWSRFDCASAPTEVLVGRDVAVGVALLTNELATNAVKYGALSGDEGRVVLDWADTQDQATLLWEERNGPPVAASDREGFGTRLLRTALLTQGGSVEREFSEAGLRCRVRFPTARQSPDSPVTTS